MMRQFLLWLTERLPPPRVIYDRNGRSPYLSRWYLIGNPTREDRPFAIYLHKFHRGDDEPELHNHPWRWAVSLILSGGYVEERRVGSGVQAHVVLPGTINFIRANDFHRVDLRDQDAWTLFLVGPKIQDWGFWERVSGRYMPWRDFINELRDPVAFRRTSDGHQK